MAVSHMHKENYTIQCLLIDEWLKFPNHVAF